MIDFTFFVFSFFFWFAPALPRRKKRGTICAVTGTRGNVVNNAETMAHYSPSPVSLLISARVQL